MSHPYNFSKTSMIQSFYPVRSPYSLLRGGQSIRISKANFKLILDVLAHSLDNLVNEVKLWRSSLTSQVNQESLPELFMNAQAYPSVRNVNQIILTLPATTVETELSFSCMRRVKTWLRSPMTSDRLSDLCVLHCHRERVHEEKTNRILANMAGEKRRQIDF